MAMMSVGERRALIFGVALLLALFASRRAEAADITVLDGGGGDVLGIISVKGFIDIGDDKKFTDITTGILKAIVFLEGPGGRIFAAMNIGLNIRKRGFETAVATEKVCTSACALTWLGGNSRHMGEGAKVGFHAARDKREDHEPSAAGDASVGYYMRELAFPLQAVIFAMKAKPDDTAWLNTEDAQAYRILYDALTKAQADRFATLTAFRLKRRRVPVKRITE
jgi:hypothetical protein